MAQHAAWKGHLKISLVSLPVQAFTVAENPHESEVRFNQLHDECKSRIRYRKVCPIHGEVPASEIVSGYEYAKGEYVIMDRDELAGMALPGEKSIEVTTFVPPESIEPEFYAGQAYFLIPDGKLAAHSYELIRRGLQEAGVVAVGEMVVARKQKLVAVRGTDEMLLMDVLHYENEVRQAKDYAPEVPHATAKPAELKLLKSLLSEMKQEEFDPSAFRDDYTETLREAIEAKVRGREVVAPAAEEHPKVINLMDAIRKSLKSKSTPRAKVQKGARSGSKKPARSAGKRRSG